jgi:hypothetical protein
MLLLNVVTMPFKFSVQDSPLQELVSAVIYAFGSNKMFHDLLYVKMCIGT